MTNPYQNLPKRSFWRSGVASHNPLEITDLWTPKFPILPAQKIATAGSCFAQHIGRHMQKSGFNYQDYEPAPNLLPLGLRQQYGYNIYSARYGNIYTVHQLSQLFDRAFGTFQPTEDVWVDNGRYYDPFRPTIEPDGFESEEEFRAIQAHHLKCVRTLFETVDIFVFTLGLTEAWCNKDDGAVYPVCPGTAAGQFDEDKYIFHNFTFSEIYDELKQVIQKIRAINPGIKFLLTVSPVPLTATASDNHVMVASSYSKSILRGVAGDISNADPLVDYFPSYEIVAAHPMRGMFFAPNMRSVSPRGVDFVMSHFFSQHTLPSKAKKTPPPAENEDDVLCDEELLEAEQSL